MTDTHSADQPPDPTDGRWEFWIDVGGTFTDCIARSPDGRLTTCKVLSSGVAKGRVKSLEGRRGVVDASRAGELDGFWNGCEVRFLDRQGRAVHDGAVENSDGRAGRLTLNAELPGAIGPETPYELLSGEEAPILAIRTVLGLRRDEPIPPVVVKLGTTRGTNALLTRRGARTALVTTRGFADVLLIANQDRPRLFDLAIEKPSPLFERVVEIDERFDAQGRVLARPDEIRVRAQLQQLNEAGIESIGICLLNSYTNGEHEQLVERIAREAGFAEVSTSSRLSPLIKIVSRGDTTVADAYLNPVLREYVQKLRSSLDGGPSRRVGIAHHSPCSDASVGDAHPTSSLKIMTSAGGLVDADRFVGKDSILSGPAGGVVGFSRVAQAAGYEKSIGFDMGGTSTDVSRFDGAFEMEYETKKAGVRIVAPMLAIETVAAGGGSICAFDGVKLAVGPDSAGADPGPACYGRGGPLTVTDVNLFLGRILPSRFPFPLEIDAVQERLNELCRRIANSPMGRRFTPVELAEGFLEIANANMVRAIRNISVAKGYDPGEYVLVTFGGAGAQHACAIARSLGMRDVLVHPFAGILSAYGIGLADVKRFAERAVLRPYSPQTPAELEPVFRELEEQCTGQVRAEGIPAEHIRPPIRSLDVRYQGVEAAITVRLDSRDPAARYEELHEQLYGYRHSGRAIEIVAARVEVVGALPEPEIPVETPRPRRPQPAETAAAWFSGREHETSMFLRQDLHSGDEITGPAIICEPTSTVVVEPGFEARVLERGEILVSSAAKTQATDAETSDIASQKQTMHQATKDKGQRTKDTAQADPIRLELFNNLFASIAEQMGITLQKTALSTNVKERLDFSCAVFSPAGDLVVNAPHIPVHLGAMSETVKAIIADNPDMAPGDVYVTNDPYRGGSHLPDVTVVTPVFGRVESQGAGGRDQGSEVRGQRSEVGGQKSDDADDDGRRTTDNGPFTTHHSPLTTGHSLLFFTASRAHHAEIGGIVPGSMPPFSRSLAEEGVLIRNFRLVERGASRESELRELLQTAPHPSRAVEDNLADIAAQVAANNRGVKLLGELVERYTLGLVHAYMDHIQRAAAQKMRMALARLSDGRYEFTDHLDDGSPICATITIQGERAVVDFTGTGAVLETNLNANRAIVTAAVLYVFRCLIQEDIPLNSGVLEPVEIVLPECLLNPPAAEDAARCPAVVGGNVETSQRVVDVLLGALKLVAASQGTMNNLTFGDESFGYYETIGGGSGATPAADGADAVHTHMTNTRLTDAEVIERRYPVRVREFSIRRGSGGAGDHRGGAGIVRKIEFLKPLKVSMLSERRGAYPPFGLDRGRPGALGRNLLRRAGSESDEDLGGKFAVQVNNGDVLTVETPGGGGYGRSK